MTNFRNNTMAVIISLLIPILAIINFILYEEIAIATGDKVALIVRGYDPSDFLRGQYIRYDILDTMANEMVIADPQNTPEDETYRYQDGYIALFDSNNDGIYDCLGDFYWEKPNVPFINAKCKIFTLYNSSKQSVTFSLAYNQDRYYIDENIVSFVEDEISRVGHFEIVGSVKSGYFRASHIEVDGIKY